MLVHLFRPVGRPLGQVGVHQFPPDQVAEQVAEGGPGGGAKADLEKNKTINGFNISPNHRFK